MTGCFVVLPSIIGTIYLAALLMGGTSEFFLYAMLWYTPLFISLLVSHISKQVEEKRQNEALFRYQLKEIIDSFWHRSVELNIKKCTEYGYPADVIQKIGQEAFKQLEESHWKAPLTAEKVIWLNQYASHFGISDWHTISQDARRILAASEHAQNLHALLLPGQYGERNPALFAQLTDASLFHHYSQIVFAAENSMQQRSELEMLKADISELEGALFYFAAQSSQHADIYEHAKKAAVFYLCYEDTPLILVIADMLSASFLGKEALRLKNNMLRNWSKNRAVNIQSQLASALCAIGAYEQELLILSEMYSSSSQMSSDLQRRMAYLQSGAMNAHAVYRESAPGCTADTIAIELESKRWNDRDLAAFFQQLHYAGRTRPQYALELCGKSTTLTISSSENDAFSHIRLSLAAMVNEISSKCSVVCKWLSLKPIDSNPPLKGFVIEKNGISYFLCMSKDNCHIIFNQLAFCMPDHVVDDQQILKLKQDSSIEQTFSDMRAAIQLYLQKEVHKVIYGNNNTHTDPKPDDTNTVYY